MGTQRCGRMQSTRIGSLATGSTHLTHREWSRSEAHSWATPAAPTADRHPGWQAERGPTATHPMSEDGTIYTHGREHGNRAERSRAKRKSEMRRARVGPGAIRGLEAQVLEEAMQRPDERGEVGQHEVDAHRAGHLNLGGGMKS